MDSTLQTAADVVSVFERYRMAPTAIDEYGQGGRDRLVQQVSAFVGRREPVGFSMLGFPIKSPNNVHKVLGTLPDMGERVALGRLARFAADVKAVYDPGARVAVVSDGYVFSDLLGIPDRTVAEYGEACQDLLRGTPVELLELQHFYPDGSNDSKRARVTEQFGITPEELERRILVDPNVNQLYRGMIYFLTTDIAMRDFPSKSQLQKEAKRLAREMMLRNESYSALVRSEFSDRVRLSMHSSTNNGTKYSFDLIAGARHSPWHSAVAFDDAGTLVTLHRSEAEERGYDLVMHDGRPYAFHSQTALA